MPTAPNLFLDPHTGIRLEPCREEVGKLGNNDVELSVRSPEDIDLVMPLIRQSFDKHFDGADPA